jgi:hypothetical protein
MQINTDKVVDTLIDNWNYEVDYTIWNGEED